MFLARPFHARRILHLHNPIDVFVENNRHNLFWRTLIHWSVSQAHELVALSDGLKGWIRKNLDREAFVIWNACDTNEFKTRNREALENVFPSAKQKIVILMIGGLHKHKGAFDLLQAVSNLCPEDKARLIFILPGWGDREEALQFISDHNLEGIVFLPGVVSDELKRILLCGSDIFVLPSYAEGQPISIIEAMSASLPIISTYIGSIPEIVEDKVSGFLFQPGDIKKLEQFILKLADNSEIRNAMGRESRKRAEKYHTMDKFYRSISELYIT